MASKNRIQAKREVVNAFGGGCQRCGYKRCLRALQFHHVDSSAKDIWSKGRGNAAIEEIRAHPERFLLLCANCHFEEHDKIDAAKVNRGKCLFCLQAFPAGSHRFATGRAKYCSRTCFHRMRTRKASENLEKRFFKHVRKTENCWIWAAYAVEGTGVMGVSIPDGKWVSQSVNRVAWKLFVGDLPEGKEVFHSCKNSLCVNPDHLFVGDRSEVMKARELPMSMRRGGLGRRPRLTESQACEIRRIYAEGEATQSELAKRYGVAIGTIGGVCRMAANKLADHYRPVG